MAWQHHRYPLSKISPHLSRSSGQHFTGFRGGGSILIARPTSFLPPTSLHSIFWVVVRGMRDPAVVFQTPGAVSDRLGTVKPSFLSRLRSCLPRVLSGGSSHNALVRFPPSLSSSLSLPLSLFLSLSLSYADNFSLSLTGWREKNRSASCQH